MGAAVQWPTESHRAVTPARPPSGHPAPPRSPAVSARYPRSVRLITKWTASSSSSARRLSGSPDGRRSMGPPGQAGLPLAAASPPTRSPAPSAGNCIVQQHPAGGWMSKAGSWPARPQLASCGFFAIFLMLSQSCDLMIGLTALGFRFACTKYFCHVPCCPRKD